jgi:VWFA-related protein
VRLRLLAAVLVLAGVVAPATGAPQQTFRSGVDLVRVDALVSDGKRVVAGLKAGDFELRDNGVLQTIDDIALESVPLTVTFVLDTSGSVAGPKMQHLASAVDLILQGLRERDRAALVTFSHRVWLRTPLTSDFEQVRKILTSTGAEGGTSLNDAVYAGLALGETPDSRALVLVFSDGMDNTSWLGDDIVERAAQRADAVVYGVAVAARLIPDSSAVGPGRGLPVVVPARPEYLPGQTDFLDAIASATGGRMLKADTTANLPKAFDEILREFRTRYLITYSPRGVDSAGWHTIEVKVKGRRAEVRARRGYQK